MIASQIIPASAAGTPVAISIPSVSLNAQDRIYFRVQSQFDGAFDVVDWDPKIQYTQIQGAAVTPTVDENNLDPISYQASKDFTLAGRRNIAINMPFSGTVRLKGDLNKLAATSDGVTVLVVKQEMNNGVNQAPQTIFSKGLGSNATGQVAFGPAGTDYLDIPVVNVQSTVESCSGGGTAGSNQNIVDSLELFVTVDSNVDLSKLSWVPQLAYVAVTEPTPDPCTGVTPPAQSGATTLNAPYDEEFYPENDLFTPQQALTVTDASGLSLYPVLQANSSKVTSGTVFLTVKKNGQLVAKDPIDLSQQDGFGNVQAPALNVAANVGDVLFLNYTTRNEALIFDINNPNNNGDLNSYDLQGNCADQISQSNPNFEAPFSFDSPGDPPDEFPMDYRGWAYIGLKANPPDPITSPATGQSPTTPLNENDFVLPPPPANLGSMTQAQQMAAAQNLTQNLKSVLLRAGAPQ